MQSFEQPLERVVAAMQHFMDEPSIRFLHITTTDAQRIGVLKHIAAAEYEPDNRKPFFFLESPYGWDIRSGELRHAMENFREAELAAARGVKVKPMPEPAEAADDLGAFGIDLKAALQCLGKPLTGLVIVLSPVWVHEPARWVEDVAALVGRRDFPGVRWIVVDVDHPHCAAIGERLRQAGHVLDARMDPKALEEDSDTLLHGVLSAPEGATGMQLTGGAGPDEPAPLRSGERLSTPEEIKAIAEQSGLPEAALQIVPMHKLKGLIMEAASFMRKRDPERAVAKQREARAFCRRMGWTQGAVMMALMLGGYAMEANAPKTAGAIFAEAREEARAAGMPELAVQAQVAIGAGLVLEQRWQDAALAYIEAGRLAAELGSVVMAIEGYRTAGQFLLARGDEEHAAQAFARALEFAGNAKPMERELSSAPEAARALASICRAHGLAAQAESLEAQAELMMKTETEEARCGTTEHLI